LVGSACSCEPNISPTEKQSNLRQAIYKNLFFFVPVGKPLITSQSINETGFELVDHPPYCPGLAPSECFLLQKKWQIFDKLPDHACRPKQRFDKRLELSNKKYVLKLLDKSFLKCAFLEGDYLKSY